MSHVNTISWTPADALCTSVPTQPGTSLMAAFPCPHLPQENDLFQEVLMNLQLQTCTTPSNLEDDISFMHSLGSNQTHFVYPQQPKRQDSDLGYGRKQIQHAVSIIWVRQLISITANGIYASIQLSMVLKICSSF